ncbi:MAG: hypothetical protein EOP19_10435 [Hyphomicrobiales bacterium]|nr:MAG: hypothetical protein EOP19_10435 [Hyphomicrobiales bacterium]
MIDDNAVRERHEKQQRFRRFNARILEPGSMWLMILGIIFLCQPWIELLHQYAVMIMLLGIIGFNVAVHIPAPEGPRVDEDDTGPVSVSAAVGGGQHG